jgi:biotin synthase
MEIESVPLNFLHPIKGTPLEGARPMPPHEILRTIAIFRLILPKADIKICGGRAVNLRGLQPLIFMAGASGMMVGNYLTQPGQDPALDLQMIKDLGLRTG